MLENKNDQSEEFIKLNSLERFIKINLFLLFLEKLKKNDCIISSMSLNVFT